MVFQSIFFIKDESTEIVAKDLKVYTSMDEFPKNLPTNRVSVDLNKETLIVPINNKLVAFHVSLIKNITQPDPDMRINFYVPGSAQGTSIYYY